MTHVVTPVDISKTLDHGAFSPFQKMVVILAALSLVVDGFDGQLIGYAIPSMIQEWGITRNEFAPAVATGLLGMALGSLSGGLLSDRFGRNRIMIASILLFGSITILIGFAQDVTDVAILRFFAGLGIGGVLPPATALTSEYTPARYRTIAIAGIIICYPVGGMLAGVFASQILGAFGWRPMFWIGGGITIAYSLLLFLTLPESARYLARRKEDWARLRVLMQKMQHPVDNQCSFIDSTEQLSGQDSKSSISALFYNGRLRDTLGLWGGFFMVMMCTYTAFSWLPTMLNAEGLPLSLASSGLMAYNLGGIIGSLVCAFAITRFGSRRPLIISGLGAAISAFLLTTVDFQEHTALLMLGLGVHGMLVNAVQGPMYALCAHIYPTSIRGTGTAAALSVGRTGSILSSFVGAAMITSGGAQSYLSLLGFGMIASTLFLLLVRNHIPATTRIPQAKAKTLELA